MQTFAFWVGVVEFFGVPIAIVGLLVTIGTGRLWKLTGGFAIVLGLTVAQPFGIVAHHQAQRPPFGSVPVDPTAVHVARAGPIPVLPFVLYSETRQFSGDNDPTAALKARSWFWLPLLTNATRLTDDCPANNVEGQCWNPPAHLSTVNRPDSLRLARSGSTYYVTLRGGGGTWKLEPGIASLAGVAYWIVTALLLLAAARRVRIAPDTPSAET